MPDWSSGDAVVNGIKIHYQRTGGNKPPLVLSHGITDNGRCWTRAAQILEENYDVIMVDARGHGRSDAPKTGYGPQGRAADLAGLIRALGLEKPYLMGHSMGADTTAHTAADYSDLVGCAILEDPPWYDSVADVEHREATARDWRATMQERKAKTFAELLAAGRERHPTWADVEFGPWAEAKQQVSFDVLQMLSELRPNWPELAARIACPTLLITGDPDLGALVTPETAAEVARLNPRLKVVRLAGAGHNIRREQFEPFVRAVAGFLAELQR